MRKLISTAGCCGFASIFPEWRQLRAPFVNSSHPSVVACVTSRWGFMYTRSAPLCSRRDDDYWNWLFIAFCAVRLNLCVCRSELLREDEWLVGGWWVVCCCRRLWARFECINPSLQFIILPSFSALAFAMYIFGLVCIVFCLTDCFHWREKNKGKGWIFLHALYCHVLCRQWHGITHQFCCARS